MQISTPNDSGAHEERSQAIVARLGRSYAAVNYALCEDGLYRFSTELHYSYGGFCGPIWRDDPGYATLDAARLAGMEELLRRWPRGFPSDPASVSDELRTLREQIENQLRQPTLF
jgi:hypothetical protein